MEDRGRSSRTYENRRTYGKSQREKTVRQSSAKKTENSGGACAYAAEKKKDNA